MRGREREWRRVDDLLRGLRAGEGGTLLVDGEPGSGKSRLLGEAARAAAGRGLGVLRCGVAELGELVPCGLLLEALGLRPEDDPALAPGAQLDRLLAAFEVRAGAPVLAVFDDLQRADPATLKTLCALHESLAGRPVGWLLSRSTAGAGAAALFDLLERHGAGRMTLAPLAPDAVAALATDTLGEPPGPATRALVNAAGGNPLLITELLAGLRDEGLCGEGLCGEGLCGEGLCDEGRGGVADASVSAFAAASADAVVSGERLPGRLRTLVRGWMVPLSAGARSLVETAAVLGGSLSLEHAAALLGTTPAALLPAMEECAAAGVLVVTAHGLAFRHELVGDVVAASIPAPVRRALADQFDALRSAPPPVALLPGPAAVEAAIAEGRLQEAEHLVRERLAQHCSVYGMAELRCLLADIMYLTGRGDEAVREAETALAVPGLPHHVRDRAALVRLHTMTRLRNDGAAATCAHELIAAHPGHGAEALDRHPGHGSRAFGADSGDGSQVVGAGSGYGPGVMVAALLALASAERERGRLTRALELAVDAGRLAGADGPGERRYEAVLATAGLLTDMFRLDEARAAIQQARKDMFEHGRLAWAADASALEARTELAAGHLDGAAAEAGRALNLADAHDTPLSAATARAVLATVALRRGDLREAVWQRRPPLRARPRACLRARLWVRLGIRRAIRRAVRQRARRAAGQGVRPRRASGTRCSWSRSRRRATARAARWRCSPTCGTGSDGTRRRSPWSRPRARGWSGWPSPPPTVPPPSPWSPARRRSAGPTRSSPYSPPAPRTPAACSTAIRTPWPTQPRTPRTRGPEPRPPRTSAGRWRPRDGARRRRRAWNTPWRATRTWARPGTRPAPGGACAAWASTTGTGAPPSARSPAGTASPRRSTPSPCSSPTAGPTGRSPNRCSSASIQSRSTSDRSIGS
ncbi:hypothetical protein GCM10022419_117390 [Nonomuraea rosea]|uniref:Orc1-like AAA ATPase domain-containing protein n=1 Tax=Nonomuraea rosea TaxID=638574 RepID=A0ABP6ZKM4_9ACTN